MLLCPLADERSTRYRHWHNVRWKHAALCTIAHSTYLACAGAELPNLHGMGGTG